MKDRFTITISDVHGSKNYSFNQLLRKFVLYFLLIIFLVIISGGGAIWWLNQESEKLSLMKKLAEAEHASMAAEKQQEYIKLDEAKRVIQEELNNKSKELQFLDQTLHGLEELIGVQTDDNIPVEDRVQIAQLTTLEKKLNLEMIPNGRPVRKFSGVSSPYGWRTHPITGKKDFHRAVDYRGKKGDPVIATADAIVEYSGYHKKSGYGNLIILVHANGFKTLYGHMSKRVVKTGDVIDKGQVIGKIGSTGLSSGPHLHYEVSFLHKKLNPTHFVKWDLVNYDLIFKKVKEVPWGSLTQRIKRRVQKVEKQLSLRDVR